MGTRRQLIDEVLDFTEPYAEWRTRLTVADNADVVGEICCLGLIENRVAPRDQIPQ